jgi:hypothetical protein
LPDDLNQAKTIKIIPAAEIDAIKASAKNTPMRTPANIHRQ